MIPVCHGGAVEIPRGDIAIHLISNSTLMNLTVLSDLCWVIAYGLIMIQCFRQRTYGLPLVAIAMNITWEVQYGLITPPRCDDGSIDPRVDRTGPYVSAAGLRNGICPPGTTRCTELVTAAQSFGLDTFAS